MTDHLLDELNGDIYFPMIGLTDGYHPIQMEPAVIRKTSFCNNDGHFVFLVMLFGLINDFATFQTLINELSRALIDSFVVVVFDDILIYSCNETNHVTHLQTVLETLATHKLSRQQD